METDIPQYNPLYQPSYTPMLIHTPLLAEIFNSSLCRFSNSAELVNIRCVTKSFCSYYTTHETQIYIYYIRFRFNLDLTGCCTLSELRVLITRILSHTGCIGHIFSINNPKVFSVAYDQGVTKVARESMLIYSCRYDSELMFASILDKFVPLMSADEKSEVFRIVSRECAFKCFQVAKNQLLRLITTNNSFDTAVYSLVIGQNGMKCHSDLFIRDMILDYCSEGTNSFGDLRGCNEDAWLVNNILKYPTENNEIKLKEYDQLVSCLISNISIYCVWFRPPDVVALLIAAAVSIKTLGQFVVKYDMYFASKEVTNNIVSVMCMIDYRVATICTRVQFEAALNTMEDYGLFNASTIERIKTSVLKEFKED